MIHTTKGPRLKRSNTAKLSADEALNREGALEQLPSVLGLVRRQMLAADRNHEFNLAQMEAGKEKRWTDERQLGKDMLSAFHRETALMELAKSIPAKTLGDAVAHLVMAYRIADELQHNDNEGYNLELLHSQLHRCLSSALRVVATTANIPLQSVGGEWIAGAFGRDFPDLGDQP